VAGTALCPFPPPDAFGFWKGKIARKGSRPPSTLGRNWTPPCFADAAAVITPGAAHRLPFRPLPSSPLESGFTIEGFEAGAKFALSLARPISSLAWPLGGIGRRSLSGAGPDLPGAVAGVNP